MTQTHDKACAVFLDRLDSWLAGDYEDAQMWAHHDNCEACRNEARLAREIGGILLALPELTGPEIRTPAARHVRPAQTLVGQLLNIWRQPLVFVPALAALVLAVIALPQLRTVETAVEPELVIIDGQEYTREEIQKAAADLQLALQYIDRYRPARVISAELDNSTAQPAAEEESSEQDSGNDAPTI